MSARAEKVARVAQLRQEGMTRAEIAKAMNVSKSTVRDLIYDPTGELAKQRKEKYRRPCDVCGKMLNPHGLRESGLCFQCACRKRALWDKDRISSALREFYNENGRAPMCDEIGSGPNRHRRRVPGLPSMATIQKYFGSMTAAFDESGIPRNPRGRPRKVAR